MFKCGTWVLKIQASQTKLVTDGFCPNSETTEFENDIESVIIQQIAFVGQICIGSDESTDKFKTFPLKYLQSAY